MKHLWPSIRYAPIKVDKVADVQAELKDAIVVGKAIRKAIELLQRFKVIQCTEVNRIHLQVNVNVLGNLIAMKITKTY